MGVLPLQFLPGESAASLGLDGTETYAIRGVGALGPRSRTTVEVTAADGTGRAFEAIVRIDGPAEVEYLRHGGILPMVLRRMLSS
jgi:aconitate hydratase